MKLVFRNPIECDTSTVMGVIGGGTADAVKFDRPSVSLNFLRQMVHSMVRPIIGHQCGPECKTPQTIIVGAPHRENLYSSAPV